MDNSNVRDKKDSRVFRVLTVLAILIAIACLSIGYAALDRVMEINSEAYVSSKESNWDIRFVNPGEAQIVGKAESGSISLKNTDVTITGVVLKAPGDSVTYTFDVENNGIISAKLSAFTMKKAQIVGSGEHQVSDQELVSKNYTYSITYDDGRPIAVSDELLAGESKKIKVIISYGNSMTQLPENGVTLSNLGATLVFMQKD